MKMTTNFCRLQQRKLLSHLHQMLLPDLFV